MVNVTKLHRELTAAGIPVVSVAAQGADNIFDRIDFGPNVTEAQRAQASALVAAHNPTDYDTIRAETARNKLLQEDFIALQNAIIALPESQIKKILVIITKILWRIAVAVGLNSQDE